MSTVLKTTTSYKKSMKKVSNTITRGEGEVTGKSKNREDGKEASKWGADCCG